MPFSTMGQQHLVYAYAVVWIFQGGYAAWVAWKWFGAKRPER